MQGNLITAPAEFDVTFDFAIYLYNRKIERGKNQKCFSLKVTSYILVIFMSPILLLMGKYFIL